MTAAKDGPYTGDSTSGTAAYIVPFLAYVGMLAAEHAFGWPVQVMYPVRCAISAALLLLFSRRLLTGRPSRIFASLGVGIAGFLIWIAPDRLFGYRHFWLFDNSWTGTAATSVPAVLHASMAFRAVRVLGSTVLVPILEELFWRGWLMRWLIDPQFRRLAVGAYAPGAFWLTAVLFASEHGPYWEVGLAAGILYNWWAIRTGNLADCMVAHAVTNGFLGVYVLLADQWQYWL